MRVLVAVLSYEGDAKSGSHQAIRDTWGKDLGTWDLRFMIGHRSASWRPAPDEILLDYPFGDDRHLSGAAWDFYYRDLIIEILRWSNNEGYDFVFLCCNDTFIIPQKLRESGFENYDYSGKFVPREDTPLGEHTKDIVYDHHVYLWADAGAGWFMSRKAAAIVVDTKPADFWGSDDIFVGQVLGPRIKSGEIRAKTLDNFWNGMSWHYRWVTGKAYSPGCGWMQAMYLQYGGH